MGKKKTKRKTRPSTRQPTERRLTRRRKSESLLDRLKGNPWALVGIAVAVVVVVLGLGYLVGRIVKPPAPATPEATSIGRKTYSEPPPMTIDVNKTYVATIETEKGDIVMELYPQDAPQTVNNFVFLAREGFYDGLTFHRVEPGFVIQGGDPQGDGTGGPGYTLPAEIKRSHTEGAVATARQGDEVNPERESSGSQFYITLAPQPGLDDQYTVFGQVTEGMDVVQSIAKGDVMKSVTIEEK
jgi:peptidyl-prolyl cis-trans isomerase B (cyclophilin B)